MEAHWGKLWVKGASSNDSIPSRGHLDHRRVDCEPIRARVHGAVCMERFAMTTSPENWIECPQCAAMPPARHHPECMYYNDVETFVINNPDGSISLDPYAGKSRDELKAHCRELCSALDDWRMIAMVVADRVKDGLCSEDRAKLEELIEAYQD